MLLNLRLIQNYYIELDNLSEIDRTLDTHYYYLPHNGGLKVARSSAKLRTVLGDSRKTSQGMSFNDIQLSAYRIY